MTMAKKRGNSEGSITQRGKDAWQARYTVNGKRHSITGKTQAEAVRKMREALASADQGQYVEPSKLTVSVWLTQWEETYGRPTWRDTTASTHHDSIKNHLIPAMGTIPLQRLGADDIQRFIISQQKAGAKPASIVKQLSPLKSAMRQAVLLKKRADNPFDGVKQPKLTQDEIEHLTEDEQRAYISALPDSTAARLLRFILGTGLRIGEALALRWSDIEADHFTVRQTIATAANLEGTDDEPRTKQSIHAAKTSAGMRSIPLGTEMKTLLDRQRIAQAKERLKCGAVWGTGKLPEGVSLEKGDGFAFASSIGTPLQARNVRRVHNQATAKANVTPITLHGLRHSFATRWVAHDSDIKGLSEILGHADVATTLRKYVHSDPAHKAVMMQKMGTYD